MVDQMKKERRRILPIVLSGLMLLMPISVWGETGDPVEKTVVAEASESVGGGYYAYLSRHPEGVRPEEEVRVDLGDPVLIEEEGRGSWEVQVPTTGFYNIRISYTAQAGKDIDIECGLEIDGERPFQAAEAMPLTRVWKDSGKASYVDASGNEYLPVQEEVYREETVYLSARDEYVDGGYLFWFEEGTHTLELIGERESFTVQGLTLCQEPEAKAYEEYLDGRTPEAVEAEPIRLEGESAGYKSHQTLYAVADMSSCATSPYDPRKSLLNTIGGESWSEKGQWMDWEFEVKTAGFYQLTFRVKQNYKSGSFSVRKLYVDGEVPFAQAEEIRFVYDLGWTMVTLGGETPQYLWLDEGPHTIRLEVVYGGFTEICAEIEECVSEANVLYRKIMMITGTSPDLLRDYNIGKLIPGCKESFGELSERLYGLVEQLERLVGKKGAETASMEKLALQLSEFAEDTETAPRRLSTFSANISSLAASLVSMTGQPLLLDYMQLSPVGSEIPAAEAPWYRSVWNEVQRFFLSFFEDYDNIGTGEYGEEDAVTLWLGVGRDQATVMYSLILSDFTSHTGIPVNLRLITQDVVMRAVAANKGPDLALFQPQATVINYALRGAAYDLNQFADIEEVKKRFHPEAVRQYGLTDGFYALPEQMNYNVMFVRTDVLEEMGLSVPQTWDDLYTVLAELQRNHMQVGVTSSFTAMSTSEMNPLFLSLLYQKGGSVYDPDGRECILNQPAGVEAFTQFCELYTKYGVSLKIDLLTHFRTGEAPVVINNVSFGNELSVSAPELTGLWEMVPFPGLLREDGTVDHTTVLTTASSGTTVTSASSSGVVMFSNARNKEKTWEFMKWWTSKEAQAEYARQIESALGRSGRWLSANLEAIEEVAWSKEELTVITGELETLRCLPEVAGGYYTGRSLNNAVRTVVNDGKGGVSPKETLYEYVSDINREIVLKRRELGLD